MDQDELSQQRVDREVKKMGGRIKRNFWIVKVLGVFAVLVLIIFWIPLPFFIVNHHNWFARGGSIVVVFFIISELLLISNNDFMKPIDKERGGKTSENLRSQDELYKEYFEINNRYKKVATYFGMAGTIIWGYGDLIWNFFH